MARPPGPWWTKQTSLSPWAFQPWKSTGESYIPWGKVSALLYVKMNLPTGFIVWPDDTSLRGANLVASLAWNKGVNYSTFAKCVLGALGTRPHKVHPIQCTWKRFQCLPLSEAQRCPVRVCEHLARKNLVFCVPHCPSLSPPQATCVTGLPECAES